MYTVRKRRAGSSCATKGVIASTPLALKTVFANSDIQERRSALCLAMTSLYAPILPQLLDVCSQLSGEAQTQGRRVVAICETLSSRERQDGQLVPEESDPRLRLELGPLVELLARRSSQAMPLATAARVALADLAGDQRFASQAVADCAHSLLMLGL